jgi:hypothetical protein
VYGDFFLRTPCKKCQFVHIHQKPRLRPKPGQAKPDFWLWARLTISSSQSHLKPGQSRGFQAKPEPAHHYSQREEEASKPWRHGAIFRSRELEYQLLQLRRKIWFKRICSEHRDIHVLCYRFVLRTSGQSRVST